MSRVTAIISALVICIIVWPVMGWLNTIMLLPIKPIMTKMQRTAGERQLDSVAALVMLLGAGANINTASIDAKVESDALRDDVAAGRRRLHIKAVCRQCVKPPPPPAWIMQPPPDWQTPLNGIISPSERG